MTDDIPEPQEPPSRRETWFRLLFVLLFVVIYSVAEFVLGVIIVIQFGFVLITHERNQRLLDFTAGLTKFIYQIVQYMAFNVDEKPFPFAPWPEVTSSGNSTTE